MTRIVGSIETEKHPSIDCASVKAFFKKRALKAASLGHVQAVIYQDKNPVLAAKRDWAEKEKLLPLLQLKGEESVLDVGCGTGRWADAVISHCQSYVGSDFSEELIEIANSRFQHTPNAHFICTPSEQVAAALPHRQFQVILSMGLLIYLNDQELNQTLAAYRTLAGATCKILLREPMATRERLTIHEHYSEEMDQVYNAIYRTETELRQLLQHNLFDHGFRLIGSGDVYEAALNNRSDTRQQWYLIQKG